METTPEHPTAEPCQDIAQETQAGGRPYHRPQLCLYGNVREMTGVTNMGVGNTDNFYFVS
jgi:hypothetical protein